MWPCEPGQGEGNQHEGWQARTTRAKKGKCQPYSVAQVQPQRHSDDRGQSESQHQRAGRPAAAMFGKDVADDRHRHAPHDAAKGAGGHPGEDQHRIAAGHGAEQCAEQEPGVEQQKAVRRSNRSMIDAARMPATPAAKAYDETTWPTWAGPIWRAPINCVPSGITIMKSTTVMNCTAPRISSTKNSRRCRSGESMSGRWGMQGSRLLGGDKDAGGWTVSVRTKTPVRRVGFAGGGSQAKQCRNTLRWR